MNEALGNPIPIPDIIYALFKWREICKTPAMQEALDQSIFVLVGLNELLNEETIQ